MSPDLFHRHEQPRRDLGRTLQAVLLAGVLLGTLGLTISCAGGGGGGGSSTPPSTPPTTGLVVGKVQSYISGQGISGATVTDGTATTTTIADGTYALHVAPSDRKQLTVTASNYGNTQRIANILGGETNHVDVALLPATVTDIPNLISAVTLGVPNSPAQVVIPANGLVPSNGGTIHFPVKASLTPIDPSTNPGLMPGDYTTSAGQYIESYGALDAFFTDSTGAPLNLASGKSATIRIPLASRFLEVPAGSDNGDPVVSIPMPAAPATVPAFYYDSAAGRWIQEGTLTLTGTGLDQYYEGTVEHFTTWNADNVATTTCVSGKVVRLDGTTPVEGAVITASGVTYIGVSSTISAVDGTFSIPVMSNSTFTVSASKGYLSSGTMSITIPFSFTTNGTFLTDSGWTKGSGWSINTTDGTAHCSGTHTASDLAQNQAVTNGTSYIVTYTISSWTAGTVAACLGGTSGTARNANGTYQETIVCGSGADPKLALHADAAFKGYIDNVSVVPAVPVGCQAIGNIVINGTLKLTGTLRDFSPSTPYINATDTPPVTISGAGAAFNPLTPWINPDFEAAYGDWWKNMVKVDLGPDNKPVYNNPAYNVSLIHSADSFKAWFTDFPSPHGAVDATPYQIQYTIDLTESDPVGQPGVYTYLSDAQFPIDGQLQGNYIYNNPGDGNTGGVNNGVSSGHNFHYTYEIHTTFTYKTGQTFQFKGDDDVWVFINKKLAIDLGGVHQAYTGKLNLDTGVVTYTDPSNNPKGTSTVALNLVADREYQFDFFYCERHTTESHMRITTSIPLSSSSVPN